MRCKLLTAALACGIAFSSAGYAAAEVVINTPFVSLRLGPRNVLPPPPPPRPGAIRPAPAQPVSPATAVSQPTVLPQDEPAVIPPGTPAGQPVEVLPPPRPEQGAPIVEPPMGPSGPVPFPVRPPTHAEFARGFRPMPGLYEVVLLHPHSGQPVRVQFELPPGQPKKVRVERNELEFDYGRFEVEIRFHRDGRATVEYNH